jgi:homoserine dehydrogenase
MAQINVGIIGFGTVGAGTVELLLKNAETIAARVGAPIVIRKIADLDIESDRGVAVEPGLLTTDAMDVIDDPAVDMVVELVGGLDKAREFMLMAMEKGKHVVTANKALLAEYGRDIYASARRLGVHLGFEASVGGGIPILGALAGGLAANRIQTMVGILNGTSNYILTRMTREGLAYEKAVEEAVRLGFAEDPPTLDVNGTDAAHKLAILLSVASGVPMDFRTLYREGIEGLSPDDIQFAGDFGYQIKLLAIARLGNGWIEARVHPAMIPKDHILANVNEAYNAIYLEGDFVGPNLFYGLGAGRRPTGSAVVSDIMEVSRKILQGVNGWEHWLGQDEPSSQEIAVRPIDQLQSIYYFRFSALDNPGVLSKISGILGDNEISVSSVIQKGRKTRGAVPVVMITHEALERNVVKAISLIDKLDIVTDATVIIRVEEGFPNGRE